MCHACVTSKLDYCNVLLCVIPDSQIVRLQRVQNTCARLMCVLFKILTDYSTFKGSALVTSTPENVIQNLADRI